MNNYTVHTRAPHVQVTIKKLLDLITISRSANVLLTENVGSRGSILQDRHHFHAALALVLLIMKYL